MPLAFEFKCMTCEKVSPKILFCERLRKLLLSSVAFFLFANITTFAQSNVTTQHNDIARTGANTNETILTPANVNTASFGRLFSNSVDGWVYAQPLYMPGVTLGAGTLQAGTTHNIVYVATEHDSVYAFDADTNTGANSVPLWQVSLIGSNETTVPSADVMANDITPEIGITSTPVIDPNTNTIYVVAKTTVANTTFIQRLHALDITTGNEKFGGPMVLSGSVPGTGNGSVGGTLHWDPLWQNNRVGLLLLNGIIYIGFGSHGDNGTWHGWILAYNATTLAQTGAWCSTPNSTSAGIWMSGTGFAADVPAGKPYGRIFTATGNGVFDAVAPNYTNAMDYGDSIIKLDLNNGVPTMNANGTVVGDDFTPHDQANMDTMDEDVASGGVVLLPDSVGGGGGAHQLVQVGKSGRAFVLNRENLGGYNPNNTTDPEQAAAPGGLWSAPAYWNGNVYFWPANRGLMAFSFVNGVLSATATSTFGQSTSWPSLNPSVSANGTTNGIVWSVETKNYSFQGAATLYAHDATNVANLLYSSATNQTRDNPGNAVKFIVPTIINGKVYVGSETQLSVYGLLSGLTQVATPVINPASQSFSTSVQVTITDSTSSSSIYYTTDGSQPTTSSTQYTVPFTLTATTTVNAIATAAGMQQSGQATATYTLATQAATPTFNPAPGNYTVAQSVVISTTTPNSTIYYTTDGTAPTTGSTKYVGPVSVGVTETLSAIAVASGLSNSPIATGLYTFNQGSGSINFASGFAAGGMNLLGSAKLNGSSLELTDGGASEAAAAWYPVETSIASFTTDFTFQVTPATNSTADGFTFAIQGSSPTAIGALGGALGFGATSLGTGKIPNSVAVKFDLYSNNGEGSDSTGLYTNGATPTIPAVDMTSSGVNLHSGDPFHVHITYDGTTLAMSITDATTNATFTANWTVNIPTIVGGGAAYVGFTAGTGGNTAIQNIQTWTFGSTGTLAAATPTFSPAAGTYTSAQTVTISDATSGATIYYTTNGTTPTTSSTQYTGAIAVGASETIEAIAVATGDSTSAVGTASYTITPTAATPTFSPVAGIYTTAQSVTISDATSGATIYYTTNGTTPTTSSTQYTGAIAVSATETLEAIAVATGDANSSVGTAAYTISSGGATVINLGAGFTAGAMTLNGNTTLSGTRLRLTDGGGSEAGSAWYNTPVNIQQFTSNFSFQITGGTGSTADGFTFVIQGGPSTALGTLGGGLGYGAGTSGGTGGIPKSVAVKFDLYGNSSEGPDSTGLYVNGATPTTPAVDMTSSGVNLHTTDVFNVQLSYDGTNLTMTITDATTNATFTHAWPINIPTTVGGPTALVGFTGGTGGLTAIQDIIGWTLSSTTGVTTAATPTFSPVAGTYTTAQTVTINDATTGATIYYTTNGTTPTTSSTQYTGTIAVNATETLEAIAVASGDSNSAVGTAAYTITLPAATPTFSPVAGTYASAQSVTISDTTSGATIYYTTNGTTPTTSSTQYTGAIAVSATETIEAIAVAPGDSTSTVGTAAYTIALSTATPTFSPAAGTYASAQSVTISDATSGATIYYTTNGTTPTTSSTQYTGAVAVTATETIEAIAASSGNSNSGVGTAVYTITPPAATPTFSPVAGTYTTAQSVTISDATSGATIYYTTNGTTPTTGSTKYTGAIAVGATETIEAIAVAVGDSNSAVGTAVYTITPPAATPTFSPVAGTYTTAQSVTISDATTGATIYYTTNGTTPTTGSTKYTGAIAVSATETIEAIAVASGDSNSAVGTAVYTITPPAATPTFSPVAGIYTTAQSVTIGDATSGATIYYTTNGTTPTTGSTKYTGAIAVGATETIEAIAVAAGDSSSAVGTAAYTISIGGTVINLGAGFTTGTMALNGNTTLNGTRLRLTDGGASEAGSAWYNTPVNIQQFTSNFSFQITGGTSSTADGFAFVIQGGPSTALGTLGGGLGYGAGSSGTGGIPKSVAVKFDLYGNNGEGSDSTGLYVNGASPTTPAVDMTGSGVNLHTTDVFNVQMSYDGTNLTMTITDATTNATFTHAWPINIPTTVGGPTALVGFTGGTGGLTAIQEVIGWTLSSTTP